jgi:hypothetical protein
MDGSSPGWRKPKPSCFRGGDRAQGETAVLGTVTRRRDDRCPAAHPVGEEVVMEQHTYLRAMRLFVEAVADGPLDCVVPACEGWDVHDLLAHQVHQLQGAIDGTFPFDDALTRLAAPDAGERAQAADRQETWIGAGVHGLRSRDANRLLDQWQDLIAVAPEGALDALAPDLTVHLFDLLGALGRTAHRTDPIVANALRFWAPFAGVVPEESGMSEFELLRAITGRRSRRQAPDLPLEAAVYGWRASPLEE